MTQDDIIAMAEEVYGKCEWPEAALMRLEAFAELVAAHEREACAKVCEEPWMGHPKEIARAIRARGQQ
jgi:hypothetical protein